MAQQFGQLGSEASKDELDLDAFFAQLRQQRGLGEIAPTHRLKLERINERQRLFAQHLSDQKSFYQYVKAHPLSALIEQKIAEEVALHRCDLARVAEEEGIQDIDRLPLFERLSLPEQLLEQYRLLAMTSCVDPSYVFREFPGLAHLCELKALSDAYLHINDDRNSEEQQAIKREWNAAMASFQKRWYALTQEHLTSLPFPPLSRLTQLIAPVPYSASWTEELYTREARSMGHVPALDTSDEPAKASSSGCGKNDGNSSARTGGSPRADTGLDVTTRALDEASTETTASEEGAEGTANSSNIGCNIDEIYKLAGAKSLRQPTLSPGEARYNFPGNLGWGEDIFYDYAVMVPVDQCDIDKDPPTLEPRNLEAAHLSASFAQSILQYLVNQNLAGALGQGMIAGLISALDDVLAIPPIHISTLPPRPEDWIDAIPPDARKEAIRTLRKSLKNKAALLRSISRMRLLIVNVGANPMQFIAALDQALLPFRDGLLNRPIRWLPNDGNSEHDENLKYGLPYGRGTQYRTLEMIDLDAEASGAYPYSDVKQTDYFVEDPFDEKDRGAQQPGWFGLPNVKAGDTEGVFEASYGTERRHKALRRYLQYLGGHFYDKLINLRNAAQNLRNNLPSGQSGINVLSEFTRLAEGVLNDMLMALARLFDDMAELLVLQPVERGESSKRLALMLVYRQFWFPEGYVAGKLVGYKNLLPNQKETFKRRTFVKTTREVTTVQEFAAAREEDFTRSSKETAELVKEASSDFNFSAKTSGGFNFLIVSGDLETNTGITRKDTSKAMHNRVAEATMKSSVKYNEKREVKVRELIEIEDVQEVTTEFQNLNREITANYFYYQLHRQYYVTTELAYIQPVLLRTRDVPHPATIDEKFLANYAHILLHALPRQLSVDMQETVGDIELLGRTLVRRRSDADTKNAAYEHLRQSPPIPPTPEEQNRWRAQLEAIERAASDARTAYIEAEENYIRARTRLDRVISHVRENICYYMQFIWQASPKVDQDKLLQDERFDRQPLGEVTRGFMRIGYYGNEEIFEYTGNSLECLNALMDELVAGYWIVARYTDEELQRHPLFQRLKRYYPADTNEMIIDRIRTQVFVRDPASPEEINNSRRVQIAQDALVVEALPGQVPLLEGFQMAHRMLDVQKACLENLHISERIKGRPWEREGEDSYKVVRREGEAGSINVSVSDVDSEKP